MGVEFQYGVHHKGSCGTLNFLHLNESDRESWSVGKVFKRCSAENDGRHFSAE